MKTLFGIFFALCLIQAANAEYVFDETGLLKPDEVLKLEAEIRKAPRPIYVHFVYHSGLSLRDAANRFLASHPEAALDVWVQRQPRAWRIGKASDSVLDSTQLERIGNETLVPRLREQDYYHAFEKTIHYLSLELSGERYSGEFFPIVVSDNPRASVAVGIGALVVLFLLLRAFARWTSAPRVTTPLDHLRSGSSYQRDSSWFWWWAADDRRYRDSTYDSSLSDSSSSSSWSSDSSSSSSDSSSSSSSDSSGAGGSW